MSRLMCTWDRGGAQEGEIVTLTVEDGIPATQVKDLQSDTLSNPAAKPAVMEPISTIEGAPSIFLNNLQDIPSNPVIAAVVMDSVPSVQDTVDQIEETEEIETTPAAESPISTNKGSDTIATPSEGIQDKPKMGKQKRTSSMSTKATKLQYLTQRRANCQMQKQADNSAKDEREQPPIDLSEIQKEQLLDHLETDGRHTQKQGSTTNDLS